jgi:arsenate reductase-like glutaredoxin family protein
MASSVSQKIGELDRVLMAVAKRGIQLADGIETVTEMEVSVLELMDQNSLILADISSTQEKIESLKTEVERLSASNLNRLSEASDKLLEAGQSNLSNVSQRLDSLDAKLRANDEVKALLANQKAIETQVRSMKNVMVKLDENVKDLYVIRQAEVESIYQDLMNRQSIED